MMNAGSSRYLISNETSAGQYVKVCALNDTSMTLVPQIVDLTIIMFRGSGLGPMWSRCFLDMCVSLISYNYVLLLINSIEF